MPIVLHSQNPFLCFRYCAMMTSAYKNGGRSGLGYTRLLGLLVLPTLGQCCCQVLDTLEWWISIVYLSQEFLVSKKFLLESSELSNSIRAKLTDLGM